MSNAVDSAVVRCSGLASLQVERANEVVDVRPRDIEDACGFGRIPVGRVEDGENVFSLETSGGFCRPKLFSSGESPGSGKTSRPSIQSLPRSCA